MEIGRKRETRLTEEIPRGGYAWKEGVWIKEGTKEGCRRKSCAEIKESGYVEKSRTYRKEYLYVLERCI